tara:strand:- start:32307 stop:32717 length:411 start_codon:yes stop_codon:yes gene_type:complete
MRIRLGQYLQRQPSLVWPLCYMLGILGVSSIPGVAPIDAPHTYQLLAWVPPAIQNLLHIPVYAGLAVLWCWYLSSRASELWAWVLSFVVTALFGALDEYYQYHIPGRYASLTDVLFNVLGAGLGVWFFWWLIRLSR